MTGVVSVPTPWHTKKTAAEYAQKSVATIERWIYSGRLKVYRQSPTSLSIHVDDLDRAIKGLPPED